MDTHTHGYENVKKLTNAGRYSPEVKTPSPADQMMPSPNINSSSLALVNPETDELPTGHVMLSPAFGSSILAPNPAKSEAVNSALYNLTIENDSRMAYNHRNRTMSAHEADDIRRGGKWHTSLAIRPSVQARGSRRHFGGCQGECLRATMAIAVGREK